jgi:PPP family 3-phenylpropionic acid transporter
LGPEQIGLVLATGTLAKLCAGPLVGRLADLSQRLRLVLAVCCGSAALAAACLFLAYDLWYLWLFNLLLAVALSPTTSIADALALGAARDRTTGFEYGWIRGSASAAFVAGTLAAGLILITNDMFRVCIAAAGLLAVASGLTATLLPERRKQHCARNSLGPIRGFTVLWSSKPFPALVAVCALVYGSHAMHDAFAVIRWTAAGVSPEVVSLLWAEAVVSEVVVFGFAGPIIIAGIGPNRAAALAAAAGVVRWLVAGATTSVFALTLIQPLHGLTFALLHLAAMRILNTVIPQHLAATAQTIYAFGPGLASTGLTLVCGVLFARLGGAAFFAMIPLCALAVPIAWFQLR